METDNERNKKKSIRRIIEYSKWETKVQVRAYRKIYASIFYYSQVS